jgi:hypothetical protein
MHHTMVRDYQTVFGIVKLGSAALLADERRGSIRLGSTTHLDRKSVPKHSPPHSKLRGGHGDGRWAFLYVVGAALSDVLQCAPTRVSDEPGSRGADMDVGPELRSAERCRTDLRCEAHRSADADRAARQSGSGPELS